MWEGNVEVQLQFSEGSTSRNTKCGDDEVEGLICHESGNMKMYDIGLFDNKWPFEQWWRQWSIIGFRKQQ